MYKNKLTHNIITNEENVIKMLDSFKKARKNKKETKNTIEELKQQGINTECFRLFLKGKGLYIKDTTPELIQEFNNRNNPIEKIPISCRLTLPEMYTNVNNVAGAMVGAVTGNEHNFTNTSREQVIVQTTAIIVPNGIVFKGALNNTEDLRIPWEDITDCKMLISHHGEIRVGTVVYHLSFTNRKLGECFLNYISDHMAGDVDDGWS